jgi:hypothetical protein
MLIMHSNVQLVNTKSTLLCIKGIIWKFFMSFDGLYKYSPGRAEDIVEEMTDEGRLGITIMGGFIVAGFIYLGEMECDGEKGVRYELEVSYMENHQGEFTGNAWVDASFC